MKTKLSVLVSLILGCASVAASAGQFEVWHEVGAKGVVPAIVSFAGDGSTQDAQLDVEYDSSLTLSKAVAKVPGSVCVGLAGNKIRGVPPSGAGTALGSKAACSIWAPRDQAKPHGAATATGG